MKIAIVGLLHHPIAEPFAGGMESHTWWLAKKLIEKGHDVTLFASGDSDPSLGLSPCIDRAFATHPKAQTILGRQACNMSAYASVIRQICQEDFDVIHNNALHPFLLLSAADLPIPMLTVLHTPPYQELAAAVEYAAARNRSGRLIAAAVSRSLAAEWAPFISASVVYNGIDVDSWPFMSSLADSSASSSANSSASPLTCEVLPNQALWYGRIVPEKAPHIAIQAALKAGYSIQIAGPIGNVDYFEEKVVPLIQKAQVEYLGHLSHPEIKQALARASVFINTPLWAEPYGLVYAEALASGTPVATFDSGASSEILDERSGVVVLDKTVEALAEAIALAAQLSRQDCRDRAISFCHINTMISGYEQLYQRLLRRQRQQDLRRVSHADKTMKSSSARVGAVLQDSLEIMGIAT